MNSIHHKGEREQENPPDHQFLSKSRSVCRKAGQHSCDAILPFTFGFVLNSGLPGRVARAELRAGALELAA